MGVRRFSADYLESTRTGMWSDREALADLELGSRKRVLDVGCGTGELTRVLREESSGTVLGCDVDAELLSHVEKPVLRGDATRLPIRSDSVDLVVCQALLINLPDPAAALAEFARVSSDLVAAIEPDNSAVTVDSSVDSEGPLARRARERFLDGVDTDVSLGAGAQALFADAGLDDIRTTRYDHERLIEPPYSEHALQDAKRKVSGEGIEQNRETMLAGATTPAEFDDLRADWRAMGRTVVEQMQSKDYRRNETVPFYVTVGRV